jgi:hypothetical protein
VNRKNSHERCVEHRAVSSRSSLLPMRSANGLRAPPVERDGLLRAAVETVAQPVLYGLADRVAAVRGRDSHAEASVKCLELVLDSRLVLPPTFLRIRMPSGP